jgi:CubicO group peptidase (beta-lactamase class C family)
MPSSITVLAAGALACVSAASSAVAQSPASLIDAYVAPYVATNNFSGQVLVRRGLRTIYEESFGEADRERHAPVTPRTRFHIASVSMQLTAAAVLRLVDQGKLRLDTKVSEIVPSLRGGDRITIRNLLRGPTAMTYDRFSGILTAQ